MSDIVLQGFAYAEELDSFGQRSLGYRLLAPAGVQPWSFEIEALARRLQAAPYPDLWPAANLFCSFLLADGRRVVAVARYGLIDHTPGERRGGLELIGVISSGELSVSAALAIYRWLQKRRNETEDFHALAGDFPLQDVLDAAPFESAAPGPLPVLPIRMWQDGALLFAATAPNDPDYHLRLLELEPRNAWQWLPLVGVDFPLQQQAQRGPVVAWTPHLAGIAVKVDGMPAESPIHKDETPSPRSRSLITATVLLGLFVGLLALTAYLAWQANQRMDEIRLATAELAAQRDSAKPTEGAVPITTADEQTARFAEALHDILTEQGGPRELAQSEEQLIQRYEKLARRHPALKLRDPNPKGKIAVGALSVLAPRSSDRVEESIRRALANKGFSDKLIQAACEQVHDQLAAETKNSP